MINPFSVDIPNTLGFTNPDLFEKVISHRVKFVESLLSKGRAVKLSKGSQKGYIIFHPSLKESKYQITYFINEEPWSDAQIDTLEDAAKRLADEGYGFFIEAA